MAGETVVQWQRNYDTVYSTRKANLKCLHRKKEWQPSKRITECLPIQQLRPSKMLKPGMEARLQ